MQSKACAALVYRPRHNKHLILLQSCFDTPNYSTLQHVWLLLVVRPLHNFLQSRHKRLPQQEESCLGSTENLNYADKDALQ
jgi:hypothetical protein